MYEDVFRPNVTICAATKEEFAQICDAATQLGLSMFGGREAINKFRYEPGDTDAIYIMRAMSLQYTSKEYALNEDDDNPEIIDWGDISHPKIQSIDDLV